MLRSLALLIAALPIPAIAAPTEGWRRAVASERALVLYDPTTLRLDAQPPSANVAVYLPRPLSTGAIGYTSRARIDCRREQVERDNVAGIGRDGAATPLSEAMLPPLPATFAKHMCGLKTRQHVEDDYNYLVPPAVAARAMFQLIALGLPGFQASSLTTGGIEQRELDDILRLNKYEPDRERGIRLAMAPIVRPPPPRIVPLASAVASGRVGHYGHSEMELGAELLLRADGKFFYGLSVGNLDQNARGTWSVTGDRLILVNVPAPKPSTIGLKSASIDPKVALSLAVETPKGEPVDQLEVTVETNRGQERASRVEDGQFSLPRPLPPGVTITGVSLALSELGVAPLRVTVTPGGNALQLVFTPGDLGVIDMSKVAAQFDRDGNLLLTFAGATEAMRFEKAAGRPDAPEHADDDVIVLGPDDKVVLPRR